VTGACNVSQPPVLLYGDAQVLFVVDAADAGRLEIATAELTAMAGDEQLAVRRSVLFTAAIPGSAPLCPIDDRMDAGCTRHCVGQQERCCWRSEARGPDRTHGSGQVRTVAHGRVLPVMMLHPECSALAGHEWTVVATSATTGSGLPEVCDWLAAHTKPI